MNKRELSIYGAGGHGKVVAEIAEAVGYNCINFFDEKVPDSEYFNGKNWNYEGNLDSLIKVSDKLDHVFIAIGNNGVREKIYRRLKELKIKFPSIIDPTANISKYATIGEACVVVKGASINCDSRILTGSIINTNATIGHDVVISEFCHTCPGVNIAGNSFIGKGSWIGINSTVIQGIKIVPYTYLGAASLVVKDITKENMLYYGQPTKEIRSRA